MLTTHRALKIGDQCPIDDKAVLEKMAIGDLKKMAVAHCINAQPTVGNARVPSYTKETLIQHLLNHKAGAAGSDPPSGGTYQSQWNTGELYTGKACKCKASDSRATSKTQPFICGLFST